MPPLLVARMRSHSSEYYREIVERRDRLVKDVDDFVASAVVLYDQMNRGGPAECCGDALKHGVRGL